jgi:selenocysteine-specific elongation factor
MGGGVVLDSSPPLRKPSLEQVTTFLKTMLEGSPEQALVARVARSRTAGLALDAVTAQMNLRRADAEKLAARAGLLHCGGILVAPAAFADASSHLVQAVRKFHDANPLVAGMSKEELRDRVGLGPEVFSAALAKLAANKTLEVAGELVHAPGRGVSMRDEESESKKTIEQAFQSAGLKVPALKDVLAVLKVDKVRAQKIVTLLLRERILIKISDDLVFHQSALADLRQKVTTVKATTPKIDVARFKDMTGVSRKYAIPLLEYLDRERVTRRVGDERFIL